LLSTTSESWACPGPLRTVDELGKKHFSIPINLRYPRSTGNFFIAPSLVLHCPIIYAPIFPGYPPANHEVQDFSTTKGTEDESYRRACCFIDALFQHTDHTLKTEFDSQWEIEKVAREFRIVMTAGQTMKEHNEFRRRFYPQVVRIAEKLMAEDVFLLYLGYIRRLQVAQEATADQVTLHPQYRRTLQIITSTLLPPATNSLNP
jgi:hypothetical protein